MLTHGTADDIDGFRVVVERLVSALRDPFTVFGERVVTTASVGLVVSAPGHLDGEALLARADVAMYAAKATGKDRVVWWNEEMHDLVVTRHRLAAELHGALDAGQFVLHYQPIVSLETGRPVGCEALLRWIRPERGVVGPDEFIPLLEESMLILPVGRWVLETACRVAAAWPEMRDGSPLSLSVNVSARQVMEPGLVDDVAEVLRSTGLQPSRLTLEITESVMVQDFDQATAVLSGLRRLGVRVAIDDFGTGYSSLGHLRRLDVDVLKIDRSFISSLTSDSDAAFVSGIVRLADSIGLETVAEGIETALQAAELSIAGCQLAQGYLFARPLPPDELMSWLAEPVTHAAAS